MPISRAQLGWESQRGYLMLPFFAAFLVLIFNQPWLASVGMLSSVILVSVQRLRWSVAKKNCHPRVDILRTKETTTENKYFISRPQYLAKDETK